MMLNKLGENAYPKNDFKKLRTNFSNLEKIIKGTNKLE